MATLEATWDSCRLYVASATDKLPGMARNPAETPSMESTGKIGLSSDQKAAKIDRRVSDGRIYIASGLTKADIESMKKDWRLIGEKKKR